MLRHRNTLCAVTLFALSVALVGCGAGGGGGIPGLNLSRVHVDSGRAAQATIGPTGGTVTATGANGTVYTLTVPANALIEPTTIAIYPVNSLDGLNPHSLELTNGFAGGCHFTPDGLRFSAPATLTVNLPAGTDPDVLMALGYDGDAEGRHDYPMEVSGQTLTFQVEHFSGYAQLLGNQNLTEDQRVDILTRWRDEFRTELVGLGGHPNPDAVLSEWGEWRTFAVNGPWSRAMRNNIHQRLSPSIAFGDDDAAEGLRSLIVQDNSICVQRDSVDFAVEALRWQRRARGLGLATAQRQLDLQTVLQNLCVKVTIDAQFPETLQPSESGTLSLRAGYSIGNGPTKYDREMAVTVIPNFATDNTQRGGLVNDGQHQTFSGSWTRAGGQPLQLHIISRFSYPRLQDVVAEKYLSAGGQPSGGIAGVYNGTVTLTTPPPNCVGPITSSASIGLTDVGNNLYNINVSEQTCAGLPGVRVTWDPGTISGSGDDAYPGGSTYHWDVRGTISSGHLSATFTLDYSGVIVVATLTGDKPN